MQSESQAILGVTHGNEAYPVYDRKYTDTPRHEPIIYHLNPVNLMQNKYFIKQVIIT